LLETSGYVASVMALLRGDILERDLEKNRLWHLIKAMKVTDHIPFFATFWFL